MPFFLTDILTDPTLAEMTWFTELTGIDEESPDQVRRELSIDGDCIVKGHARLLFEDADEPFNMLPGDHVLIPAHRRHRVEWTTPDEATVWLAIFYRNAK